MTKIRFKTIALRALIGFYRGLSLWWRAVCFLGRVVLRGARSVGHHFFLPIILRGYHLLFALRRRIVFVAGPIRSVFVFVFSHRHIIHTTIFAIAIGTSVASLGMRVARAEDMGTRSILYTLVTESATSEVLEEDVVYESVPPVEYLVDVVAVSETPAIDFDYIDESYVSTITGARPSFIAPRDGAITAVRTTILKYVVKEGDTISSIADAYQLSMGTLLSANKLTVRSYIRPGDTLTILPTDGVLHVVKKNDTIDKLARTYVAEARDILAWNTVDEKGLTVGAEIFVPGGRMPSVAPSRTASSLARVLGTRPADVATLAAGFINLWPTTVRRITQYFTWRHTGVDIAGPTGTPIYAAEDGIVAYAGWSRGYGLNVVVEHDGGYKTRYAHDSKLLVARGDVVKKGQAIALMGSTGRSTGPHIHFEVIQNGRFKNPFDFIR